MLPPPGFRDLSLCGTGATSQVYRATDVRTGRLVALKRLHRQLADSADALARLKRELEALARLRHPSIVPVRDVIRWQGAPTVVMDFIDGCDLKELIRQHGSLSKEQIEVIARALFGALSAAHAAGIVHRDVKPQNVRITPEGAVYLLDFGSARLEAGSQLTKTGTTLGTPDYMPPELFAGTAYDPRVDIYGAGATLFECAAGRLHQTADSLAELAFKRTNEDAPRIKGVAPGVSLHLAQVIDRCLARDPNDRYSTAALAIWALDHPDAEHAFAMRLATRPPCLHCGAPIAKESEACSACGSDHPFSYAPGWSHVVIRGVRDPGRFFLELNARFPEWRTREHARVIAERCALVEKQRQRLISFVDRDEAEKLVRELDAAGAQCELVDDEGATRIPVRLIGTYVVLAAGLFLGRALLTLTFGGGGNGLPAWLPQISIIFATVLVAVVDRFVRLRAAEQGLFSRRSAPVFADAPLYFGTAAFLTFSLGLAAPSVGFVLREEGAVLTSVAQWIMMQRPFAWWIAGALAAVAASSAMFRLSRPPLSITGSPEPTFKEKLLRAFKNPLDLRVLPKKLGATTAFLILALVPTELLMLQQLRRIDEPSLWLAAMRFTESWRSTSRPTELLDASVEDQGENQSIREDDDVASATREAHDRPLAKLRRGTKIPDVLGLDRSLASDPALMASPSPDVNSLRAPARAWVDLGLEHLVLLFLTALLITRLWLKKRTVVKASNELLSAIDLSRATRAEPPLARRQNGTLRPADRLARTVFSDRFIGHAKRRGVELIHCLDGDDALSMERALKAAAGPHHRAVTDRSYLARCILETDPELELRFRLLALEGEFEARAAEAWSRSLSEDGRRAEAA